MNKEQKAEYDKKYRRLNDYKIQEYAKKYRGKHKTKMTEETKEQLRQYREENPDKARLARSKYQRYRSKIDPRYRLNKSISRGIRLSLKGSKNGHHWEDCVGYTLEQFMKHIKRQFQKGMNWENYGAWHIDHKVPISAFNFTEIEHIDFKRCWALSNLQPFVLCSFILSTPLVYRILPFVHQGFNFGQFTDYQASF